jgi:hypothetical protein
MVVHLAAECALPMDPLLLGSVLGIAVVACLTGLALIFFD